MKGRILALGALLALCALLLTACGRDGFKSEKEIMADVEEKRAMDVIAVSDLPIEEVSSLKVLKRQTNKELKNDFVYVTVEADTETAHFVRSMKLTYNYYDDQGWVLDEYEPYAEGENSTKPLKGPDNAVVDDFFAAVHDKFKGFPKTKYASWSVEGMDTDLENAESHITVNASRETNLIKTKETFIFCAEFDPLICDWRISGNEIKEYLNKFDYELKVEPGFYMADGFLMTFTVLIKEINLDDNTISLDFSADEWGSSENDFECSGVYELQRKSKMQGVDYQDIQGTRSSDTSFEWINDFSISAKINDKYILVIAPGYGMSISYDATGSNTFTGSDKLIKDSYDYITK